MLKNDSIYVSVNGIDYEALPNLTGNLAGKSILDTETRIFNDNRIIKLFDGSISSNEAYESAKKLNNGEKNYIATSPNKFMIGAVFYDCKKENIKDIIWSPIFAENIRSFRDSYNTTKEDCIKYKNDIKGFFHSRIFK